MKNWKKFFVAAVAVGAVFSTNVAEPRGKDCYSCFAGCFSDGCTYL